MPTDHFPREQFAADVAHRLRDSERGDGPSARYEWGRQRVVVSFTDRGVGIAADDLERIFAPFQRAYDPATRDVPGGGLGLSIVKQLVELMHGSIWVESEPGRGSVFHVAFPTADGAKGSAGRAQPQR